jgi:hypothetical protein
LAPARSWEYAEKGQGRRSPLRLLLLLPLLLLLRLLPAAALAPAAPAWHRLALIQTRTTQSLCCAGPHAISLILQLSSMLHACVHARLAKA